MSSAESRHSAPEADKEMERRKAAIKLFIEDPQEAATQFPDLADSLRAFVLSSTNPYENEITGAARDHYEHTFDQWIAAKDWSLKDDTG